MAKSFISVEHLPPHVFVLSDAEKQLQFEGLRMMKVRNQAFWDGIAARDKQLEDLGFNPWARSLDKDKILRELASKGGRAPKADWLTSEIRRIVDEKPEISEGELRKQLSKLPKVEFLSASEMPILPSLAVWIQYMDKGRVKEVPCIGLKDRLSRAKQIRTKRLARVN